MTTHPHWWLIETATPGEPQKAVCKTCGEAKSFPSLAEIDAKLDIRSWNANAVGAPSPKTKVFE